MSQQPSEGEKKRHRSSQDIEQLKDGAKEKSVFIRPHLVPKLEGHWKRSKRMAPNFTVYVNELLDDVANSERFANLIAPQISKIIFDETQKVMFVRDEKENGIAEVRFKGTKLWCTLCQKQYCDHILFTLLQPEVSRFLLEAGQQFKNEARQKGKK